MVVVGRPVGERTPTIATTMEALSVTEWRPSERIEIAPLARPKRTRAKATTRFRTRTRRSTADSWR
jgi:hypothetical protein